MSNYRQINGWWHAVVRENGREYLYEMIHVNYRYPDGRIVMIPELPIMVAFEESGPLYSLGVLNAPINGANAKYIAEIRAYVERGILPSDEGGRQIFQKWNVRRLDANRGMIMYHLLKAN